jgi:hypothetical protein
MIRLQWFLGLVAFVAFGAEGIAQSLVADYRFDGTYSSVAGNPPDLEPIGLPEFTTNTVDGVVRRVLGFPEGSGCRIPSADQLLGDAYTVAVLFRFNTVTSWRRVMDFKNRVSDWGLYSFWGNLNFYDIAIGSGGEIVPGAYVQVVLTRGVEGNVRGYVNGSPEIEFIDLVGHALVSADGFLAFFQDDLDFPGESSSGAVARIRIWDGPLSAVVVANLDRLPGDGTGVPPTILGERRIEVTEGASIDYQVVVTGDEPRTFSATNLPAWLSFDAVAGRLTGTARDPGIYEIRISVFNTAGADSRSFLVLVEPEAGSVVSFDRLTIEVLEDAGAAAVRLVRLGNVTTPASVAFRTVDGTGQAGQTYVSVAGELELAPEETEWIIEIPLLYRLAAGPDVDFFVELHDAVEAEVGQENRVRIVVFDRPLQKTAVSIFPGTGLSWRSLAGLFYALEASMDLVTWEPLMPPSPGTGAEMELPIDFAGENRFYRLRITGE